MAKGWVDAGDVSKEWRVARGENGWPIDADGLGFTSSFGSGRIRVQTNDDGTLAFDRLVIREERNINVVVWGQTKGGAIFVAVVNQARPFADNPDGTPADPPIIFGQPCVMGFAKKLFGEKAGQAFEDYGTAALREALEEAGATSVLDVEDLGWHNPNPTFVSSWSKLLAVQVDLSSITADVDAAEGIRNAEYLPLWEVIRRIGLGEFEGVNYQAATPNNAFWTWLARHPTLLRH